MSLTSVASASMLALLAQSPALQAHHELGLAIQPRELQGLEHRPLGAVFIGGFATPGGTERNVVEFYTYSAHESFTAALPIARRARETRDGQGQAQWADGRTCPGLYSVLAAFQRISPPLFYVHPITEPTPRSIPPSAGISLHGGLVSVWGHARQADGAPIFMTLSGGEGLIDEWVRWADRQLQDCWTLTEPPKPDGAED